MKWYAISGSWRTTNEDVKKDVERIVREIISGGNGIIAGGALGVDYYATEVVLKEGDLKKQLRIYLPIKLRDMCRHYKKRADEGVITQEQANIICSQLKRTAELNSGSIYDDTPYTQANEESYFARNNTIIQNCDVLYAFQVNDSKGTQDAIDKARKLGKKVYVRKYHI